MQRVLFIINPRAGSSENAKVTNYVKQNEALRKSCDVDFTETEYAGHAEVLAKEGASKGYDLIVAVGGDGTVNEIGRGLLGSKSAMGIIPKGSGNGLARHLKIPLKTEEAVDLIVKGQILDIDAGKINEHVFFCTAGIGLESTITEQFAKSTTRGLRTYVKLIIKELISFKALRATVIEKGKEERVKFFTMCFANANQYGNNFYISPFSSVLDRQLNFVSIAEFPKSLLGPMTLLVRAGKLSESPYYYSRPFKEVTVKTDAPIMYHFDGDPGKVTDTFKVSLLDERLKVVCPLKVKV